MLRRGDPLALIGVGRTGRLVEVERGARDDIGVLGSVAVRVARPEEKAGHVRIGPGQSAGRLRTAHCIGDLGEPGLGNHIGGLTDPEIASGATLSSSGSGLQAPHAPVARGPVLFQTGNALGGMVPRSDTLLAI